jgi:hypothetical protein
LSRIGAFSVKLDESCQWSGEGALFNPLAPILGGRIKKDLRDTLKLPAGGNLLHHLSSC